MTRTQIRTLAIGSALCMGIAGTMAVRAFFDRPGESALRLMSADADAVFIEDLVPAPNQVMAFHRIEQALVHSGMKDGAFNVIGAEIEEEKVSKAIGKYLGRSLAFELRYQASAKAPGSPIPGVEGICFVSLTNAGAAKVAMQNSLKSTGAGVYKLGDGKFARIADGYLQLASSTRWFAKVDAVANGTAEGITSSKKFAAVRKLTDPGANIKFYAKNPKSDVWGVLSGSVDDGGLRVDVRGGRGWASYDNSPRPKYPIGAGTMKMLPSGAYMLLAIAQPGAWARDVSKTLGKDGKGLESAFNGDFAIGLYPSQKPWAGIDILLVAGSNHGATPRDEFRTAIHELQKGPAQGKPIFGSPTRFGGALIYGPSADTKRQLKAMLQSSPPGVRSDVLFKHKTLAYATRGEALYISTSLDLLKRSLAGASGGSTSISGDPEFLPFSRSVSEGNQFMLAIDFQRIISGILNTASAGNKDAAKAANDIRVVTNGDHILNLNAGFDRDGRVHGHVFIPLDYGRIAKLMAQSKN